MKVQELINKLSGCDPNANAVIWDGVMEQEISDVYEDENGVLIDGTYTDQE